MALTTEFSLVWQDPHTADRDRKRFILLLLEDVTLLKSEQKMFSYCRFGLPVE